jgi:branched-chain amino acid transport system substrate-binding protein
MAHKGEVLTRRDFLRSAALAGAGLVAASCAPSATPTEEPGAPTATPTTAPTKDEIIIGGARPLEGANAIYEQTAFGPVYRMWIDEVNDRGGIYVEEYGKQLPIAEPIIYNDTSDLGTMTRLVEKLMVEDQVDFVLPPASTSFLFAAAPLFNKYEYILLGAEGGATTITELLPTLPYFFGVLNYSDRNQIPVFADILEELGATSAAILYLQDLHGIEYSGVAVTELGAKGIDIAMIKSIPFDLQDSTTLLQEAQALDVDALCLFCYPPAVFGIVGQAAELGINFNAVLMGPGGCFNMFKDQFGPVADGVMFEGAWNCQSHAGTAEFCDKFIPLYGEGIVDWWGHLPYYGGLQFLEQAIEAAGTLDQSVIRDVMATETFDTVMGPTWFDTFGEGGGGLLAVECYAGQIGQWQDGVPEVIDPGENRTADPVYPKPDWPPPPEE